MKGWKKPKTNKLYVHPPKAERMIMLFPDFKITNSVIKRDQRQGAEDAHGFIMLAGSEEMHIPWLESRYQISEDGIPIHSIHYENEEMAYSMEAFCSMDRVPTTYTRVIVQNKNPWKMSSSLSFIPRSGREGYMMGLHSDGYCSYEPKVELWGMLPSNWAMDKHQVMSNGSYAITVQADKEADVQWIKAEKGMPLHLRHRCKLDFEMDENGKFIVDIALAQGDGRTFDYEIERSKTKEAWSAELGAIQHYPNTDSPYYRKMFLHLVSQMLQMIVSHKGENYTTLRQGGMERGIWPTEAVEFLVGLDAIGLFHYSEAIYDYFHLYQVKEGEDKGIIPSMIAQPWGNNTGSTMWGLSQHLMSRGDKQIFLKYRQMLMDGYGFMERMREMTLVTDFKGSGKGLFPPMKATDWGGDTQAWCVTDGWNLMGYEQMTELFAMFDDPEADKIKRSYEHYANAMKAVLDDMTRGHENDEEIIINNRLDTEIIDPPRGPYFSDGPITLIRAGVIKSDSVTFTQIENYFRSRGLMKNGLCGLMTDSLILHNHAADKWAGHTWYTSYPELPWFLAWMERGELNKAEETFQALVKYSMSDEFYIAERYADNDPTFAPWQPNGSANGRMLQIMFRYFGNIETIGST